MIVVTVRNPSGTPVLAALSARAALLPAWLAAPHGVSVPRRTRPPKFRPGRLATVGVAPGGRRGRARRAGPGAGTPYLLTAAVGQEGGRLRVHRLRLGPVSYPAAGRDERFPSATLR